MHTDVVVIGDDWATVSRTSLMLYRRGFSVMSAGPGTNPVDVARECDPRFVVELRSPHLSHSDTADATASETDGPRTVVYQRICSFEGTPEDRLGTFAALAGALSALDADESPGGSQLRAGDLEVDTDAHLVRVAGQTVELAATPFELLRILMHHTDQVLSKAQLLDLMYGYDGHSENLIEAHISTIRRAIDFTYPHIETVRGVGYVIRSAPSTGAGRETDSARDSQALRPPLASVTAFPIPLTIAGDSPPPPETGGAGTRGDGWMNPVSQRRRLRAGW